MKNPFLTKSGWKIIPKLEPDPKYAEHVKNMAAAMREANPDLYNRPKPVKPDGMSQEEWIESMQQPSTQALMQAHKDPDYKRDWTAPIPENYLANPDATTVEELVGERTLSAREINIEEQRRRRPKNTLGQSDWSTSQAAKDRAIDHFLHSPGIPENLLSDAEIMAVKEANPQAKGAAVSNPTVWKKLPWYKALWHWLKGNEVRRDIE